MNKLLIAICLTVAFSLGMGGCAGARPEPEPAPRESLSAEPPAPEPNAVIAASAPDFATPEPNETPLEPPETSTPPIEEPTPPIVMPDVVNETPTSEPNGPPLPEADPEPKPQERAVMEPSQVNGSESEVVAPDAPSDPEPIAAEPTDQETPPTEEPPPSEPGPLDAFYEDYAEMLRENVLKDGRVDYASLRRQRLRLKRLLSVPDELDPNVYESFSKEDKLAFWINTYNLKMLEIIARNYPIQSSWWLRLTWPPSDIRHIGGIWSDYRFIVMDEEFTLGDVERRLFARLLAEPRAYLATTYATRSSPTLARTPYRGATLEKQLDAQVKAFLAGANGLRIDRDEGIVYLSALFKPTWRGKDFVGQYGTDKKFKAHPPETRAVLNFLTRYISPEDVYYLEVENYTIRYMNFDWRLNDGGRRK